MKDWNERVGSIRIANAYLRQRSFWTAAASSNQIIATIWIGDSMSVRWNGVAMSQMATWNSFPYPSTAACVSGSSFRVKSLKNKKKKKNWCTKANERNGNHQSQMSLTPSTSTRRSLPDRIDHDSLPRRHQSAARVQQTALSIAVE